MTSETREAHAPVPGWLVAGAALGMLALGLALLHYGLDLIDEGTLLAQFDRVRMGQWPYRDFHTGYTPGAFALNAALWSVFGTHLEVVRLGLVVTHAVGLAGLAVLAARALGGRAAAVVLALTVSFFLPIAPGAFCIWNIPYPSWYAQTLGTLGLLAALAVERRGRGALAAGGLCWGLAFCFKQNTGILGLAAMLVWRAIERDHANAKGGLRALGIGLALVLAGGIGFVVVGGSLGVSGTLAVAVPVAALALCVGRTRPEPSFLADAGLLVAGFAGAAAPMLAVTGWQVGWQALASEVLHLGSRAVAAYHAAYPGPEEIVAAVAGLPRGLRGIRQAADVGWLVLLPVTHLIAALGLHAGSRTSAWRLLVPTAVLSYLQLYPRADFWHLLPLAGVSLIVAVGVGKEWITRVSGAHERNVSIFLAGLLALATVRWLPNVAVLWAVARPAATPLPQLARASVRWDLAAAPALRAVPEVVGAVAGAPQLIGFPALAVFNFLAGVPSPLRHDYFFPGLLTDDEKRAVAATVAEARAARVVVLREPVAFFADALAGHGPIDEAIVRTFPVVARIGPYEVRESALGQARRRDVSP